MSYTIQDPCETLAAAVPDHTIMDGELDDGGKRKVVMAVAALGPCAGHALAEHGRDGFADALMPRDRVREHVAVMFTEPQMMRTWPEYCSSTRRAGGRLAPWRGVALHCLMFAAIDLRLPLRSPRWRCTDDERPKATIPAIECRGSPSASRQCWGLPRAAAWTWLTLPAAW